MEEQHSQYFDRLEITLATLSVLLRDEEQAKHEAAARLVSRQLLKPYLLVSSVLLKRGISCYNMCHLLLCTAMKISHGVLRGGESCRIRTAK